MRHNMNITIKKSRHIYYSQREKYIRIGKALSDIVTRKDIYVINLDQTMNPESKNRIQKTEQVQTMFPENTQHNYKEDIFKMRFLQNTNTLQQYSQRDLKHKGLWLMPTLFPNSAQSPIKLVRHKYILNNSVETTHSPTSVPYLRIGILHLPVTSAAIWASAFFSAMITLRRPRLLLFRFTFNTVQTQLNVNRE